MTQSYDKRNYTKRKFKKQSYHTKTPTKSSITQRLRTDGLLKFQRLTFLLAAKAVQSKGHTYKEPKRSGNKNQCTYI